MLSPSTNYSFSFQNKVIYLSKINSCLVGASLSADLANRYILTIVAYFTGLEAVFGIFLLPTTYKSLPSVNKELPSKDSSSSWALTLGSS